MTSTVAYQWPVSVHSVQISVADTRVLDVDKNLIGAGLLYGNLLVLDGASGLVDDLRPLLLWNGRHVGSGLNWKGLDMLFED